MMDPGAVPKLKACIVQVEGRVQGVGFRYSARQEAIRRKVKGWVRNEDNGSVRLYCEGPEPAVESFLAWLGKGPPGARVIGVKITPVTPEKSHKTFVVTF